MRTPCFERDVEAVRRRTLAGDGRACDLVQPSPQSPLPSMEFLGRWHIFSATDSCGRYAMQPVGNVGNNNSDTAVKVDDFAEWPANSLLTRRLIHSNLSGLL